MEMEGRRPTTRQKELLRRRGLDPNRYIVVRVLYGSVWFKDVHTGMIKIIEKRN